MKTDRSNTSRGGVLAAPVVYLSGMLQGLTLVSFPASSAMLKSMQGFSDAQYGAIFLPQVALAVVGALAGGSLATRWGLKTLLWLGLVINALSQVLLAATAGLSPPVAYAALLAGTGSMGLGFGLAGAPLNGLPPLLFPNKRDSALVALHTLLGLGLALGPWIASSFVMAGHWVGFPLLLAGFAAFLAAAAGLARFPSSEPAEPTQAEPAPIADPMPLPAFRGGVDGHPVRLAGFWLFALACVLYAFAEGTFSNWAVLYLQDIKHLPETVAAGALSVFWAAMVGGRLLAAVLVLRLAPERIWLVLPLLMIMAFLLLPYADTPVLGIGLFAFAGLACSAFFPLSIGLASRRFERHVPWVSSALIAALMVGVGLGSYLIGLLQEALPLGRLYQLSALYPTTVLVLAWLLVRESSRAREPRNSTRSGSQSASPGLTTITRTEESNP
jgi:fucose permease